MERLQTDGLLRVSGNNFIFFCRHIYFYSQDVQNGASNCAPTGHLEISYDHVAAR